MVLIVQPSCASTRDRTLRGGEFCHGGGPPTLASRILFTPSSRFNTYFSDSASDYLTVSHRLSDTFSQLPSPPSTNYHTALSIHHSFFPLDCYDHVYHRHSSPYHLTHFLILCLLSHREVISTIYSSSTNPSLTFSPSSTDVLLIHPSYLPELLLSFSVGRGRASIYQLRTSTLSSHSHVSLH